MIHLLTEASELLASSLDYEKTLTRVAELAVPRIADWCAVDIVNTKGEIERLAVAHIDPKKIRFVHQIEKKYPPDPNASTGVPEVIRTGKSEFYPNIPQEMLDAAAIDDEHLRIIRELALVSAIVVPLVAQEKIFGAITFVAAESKRHYTEADLAVAEDLGRLAGLAIANAGLYRKAQDEIKERRETEEQLREAKEKAEKSERDLASANQAKDRFLAMLSHELRTPLTPVLAAIETLLSERVPEELRPWFEIIQRNVELEARLIDDLLDLTRVSKGKLQLRIETVDIHVLIPQVLGIYREELREKKIRLVSHLETRTPLVKGDPARLQQIFWNLIKNAIKFTPEGGTITVRTSGLENHRVSIEVKDTGIGIEPDMLGRIFEEFEQAGEPGKTMGGLGLGLTISKQLAEAQGGTIAARSEGKGKGSSFTVELASTNEPIEQPKRRTGEPDAQSGTKQKILLVDDHIDTSNVVRMLLERQGYEIVTAYSAAEALRLIAGTPVDLIISDIGLPDESGLEMLPKMRKLSSAPAIALSGFGSDDDIQRSYEAGFQEHVTKPFKIHKLRDEVMKVLKQTSEVK
ncbi:MAG TPA: ATP-binding protein [Candidatus Kapabacteria bacterium]|nr:ATP-binding protein [Candidatus Kapabacteria bacterium]